MSDYQLPHLAENIDQLHRRFQEKALQQVNILLSIRNWLIGLYIVQYELNGADRAQYGERLMKELAKRLKQTRGMSESQLYLYREFYLRYPQIFLTLSGKLKTFGLEELSQQAA